MADQKELILQEALKRYMKYGVKSVRMEDLADNLGISKKTIYQHFQTKDDLVHQALLYDLNIHRTTHDNAIANTTNAIDQLFEIWKLMVAQMGDMNPSCMLDLKRYYPESWKEFEKFKQEYLYVRLLTNLELGITQKLYRSNLNKEATTIIYLGGIEIILEDDSLRNKYNISMIDLIYERIIYHIRAIATPEGIDLLEKKLKSFKNE